MCYQKPCKKVLAIRIVRVITKNKKFKFTEMTCNMQVLDNKQTK